MINNVFVINPVRTTYIQSCIDTLYKYTDMKNNKVVVVDQTAKGLNNLKGVHLILRPHRNLGFAKSMNEGIIHGIRWKSKYITCLNDDIEFINKKWWEGIEETFQMSDRILGVNPMSPREPGWGYGMDHGHYIDLLPYKKHFSEKDYEYLLEGDFSSIKKLPDTYPRKKTGVIDAIATWCTIFKREFFDKIGFFEERYYPGGGEDYDLDARCYREDYRLVGTTKSWVWHWWGSSKDHQGEIKSESLPIIDDLRWNSSNLIWPEKENGGQNMDPWGKWTDKKGLKHPMKRDDTIGIIDM